VGNDITLHTFGNVKVEEITVENGLNAAGNDGNRVEESLGVVAVDPVEYVEGTVAAECEQIMARDRLCLAGLRDHEQLWQYGNRLQVDGKCPQYLSPIEKNILQIFACQFRACDVPLLLAYNK